MIAIAVMVSLLVLAVYFYNPVATSIFLNNLLRSITLNITNVTNPNYPNAPNVSAVNNATNSTGGGTVGILGSGFPGSATNTSNASIPVSLEISNLCSSTPLFEGIVLHNHTERFLYHKHNIL